MASPNKGPKSGFRNLLDLFFRWQRAHYQLGSIRKSQEDSMGAMGKTADRLSKSHPVAELTDTTWARMEANAVGEEQRGDNGATLQTNTSGHNTKNNGSRSNGLGGPTKAAATATQSGECPSTSNPETNPAKTPTKKQKTPSKTKNPNSS